MTDSDFDDLLEGILEKDARVEPLVGLDERVIKRIMVPRLSRSWKPLRWSLLAASSICLLIAIGISHPVVSPKRPSLSAKSPTNQGKNPISEKVASENRTLAFSAPRARQHANTNHLSELHQPERGAEMAGVLPKLDVFPTPTQLSEPIHELAVLSFQQGVQISGLDTSLQQAQSIADLAVEPIKIAAIEIPPLVPPSDMGKDNVHQH